MNTRTMKRPAALLTALCLLITLLPSAAVEAETMQEQPSLSTSSTLTETSNIIPTLETVAQDCKILNYVDEAVFRQNNHLSRLESEESLDNYVFLNQDGSKTVYYMGEAVKYRDSTGTIREKDITLTLRNGNYTTTQNNVLLSIPTNLSNGIRLNYEGYQVSLQPQGGSMLTLPRLVDNTVSYTNYFGTGMTLNYTPTLSGLKEEIILSSYTGANSFSFLLNTGGLTLYQSKDGYYLAENAAEPKIRLGDIIIFDAIGKPDEGTLTVSTVTPGQQYRLTVSADPEFLTDPETVYPVTIDPTLTVSDNTYGAGAIADAPIFQGLPNGNFGNFPFNRVGNAGGNYGVGRTVVRLTGLINDAAYRETSSNQVSSVVFYIREGSGKSGTVVNLHPLTSNSTWSETGVTWNNVGAYAASAATVTLTGNRFAAFDITGLAQNWKQNVYNANCGFVLISTTETTGNNALCSSEYTTTDWRPYVVATYQYSSETLSVGEGSTLTLTPPNVSGTITWASSNTAIATVNSSGVVTGVKAGYTEITASVNGSVEKTYKLYVTLADGVYYLQNALSGYFLTAQNGEIGNGTPLLASTKYATTTDTVTRLRQMFKIKHLGSGRYSVRPMHKLNMGLDVTSDDLDIWNVNTTDTLTGVPSYGQWTIQWDTNGYVFTNQSYGLTMQSTSTTLNARVVTGTSTSSAGSRWVLTKMTESLVGIYLYDTLNKQVVTTPTKYVAPGETRTLSSMSLACIAYSPWTIDQSVTWSSYYQASVASDGTVTGLCATGGNTIYVTAQKAVNGYDRTASFKLLVTEIPNGTYYLKNKETERHADIRGASMADGTVIHQYAYNGGASQRWTFTHLGDGTYSIKSANSTTAYYLGVSGDSEENNAPIVLRTGAITDGMKWAVTKTDSFAYKIMPKTGVTYSRVLAVGWYAVNTDSIALQQRDYVGSAASNDNFQDEWHIASSVDIGMSTDNYTANDPDADLGSYLYANTFYNNLLSSPGGGPITKTHHYNMGTVQTAGVADFSVNGAISNDIDFMIYIGHGHPSHGFEDDNGNHIHYDCSALERPHEYDDDAEVYTFCPPLKNVYTNDITFGSSESDLRWVWMYTCNFLNSYEDYVAFNDNSIMNVNNFVTDADLKAMMGGAHIVLGYGTTAYLCNTNATLFGEYLRRGNTIIEAFFMAGDGGEANETDDPHIQKVLYIPQAINETIYSPYIQYQYSPSDVKILYNEIQVDD